jgi:hypothetical protein
MPELKFAEPINGVVSMPSPQTSDHERADFRIDTLLEAGMNLPRNVLGDFNEPEFTLPWPRFADIRVQNVRLSTARAAWYPQSP